MQKYIYQNFNFTFKGEIPKWTASEALDWGDIETITAFPLFMLERNSSKLCFSSMTVSADVTQPLQLHISGSITHHHKGKDEKYKAN